MVGALYGKLIHHEAALAGTVAAEGRVPLPAPRSPLEAVAVYPRAPGEPPYRVVRDTTVHPPFGRYAVYVGARRLGAQLSVPGIDDCRRMEGPPEPPAALEERVSARARQALAMGSARASALHLDRAGLRIRAADAARLAPHPEVKRAGCKDKKP